MKKIITLITLVLFLSPLFADAATKSSSTSSRSSSSRSSSSSSYSKPSAKSSTSRSITTSTRPVTSRSTSSVIPTNNTTSVNSIQYTNMRWGADYNNGFNSPFISSLWWSIVWSIAGNMIYDVLKPDQHLGNSVNDGKVQYAEILNWSWEVVWYKPTWQLQSNEPVTNEDHTVAWLVFVFALILLWILFIKL